MFPAEFINILLIKNMSVDVVERHAGLEDLNHREALVRVGANQYFLQVLDVTLVGARDKCGAG